ncbi:dihydroneopterin aldolase [Acidimicrobiaceae bacterium]|nr:dihydroneopterin aldolase [Acidimicrobiaceae bacterium]
MPLTIQVEGINVYGTHGVYDQEKINGQNFRIDLLIELKENILNFGNYKSESFENTINYENLVNEVINVSDSNSFDLIETFAYEILNSLRKYKNISKATVTIHKPNSPLKEIVEDISVTAIEEF